MARNKTRFFVKKKIKNKKMTYKKIFLNEKHPEKSGEYLTDIGLVTFVKEPKCFLKLLPENKFQLVDPVFFMEEIKKIHI